MNIIPRDIAERVYNQRRFWSQVAGWRGRPLPDIVVEGTPQSFGELILTFSDGVLNWGIYISKQSDLQEIKAIAQNAMNNFADYADEIMMEKLDS